MRCSHVGTVMQIFLFTEALLNIAKCEFYTSVAELATLFNTEREIAETLQKYVEVEEKRLHKVKRASKQYADLYRLAKTDAETFLSNPVNAFLLVKRLSADWLALNELVLGIEGQVIFHNISKKGLSFPDKTDLSGAVEALIRLQETYVLNTSTIARGHIAATIPSFQLTASDCFELGRQAYYAKDVNHSLKWMEEALRKIDEEDVKTINKTQILEYMAFAAYDLYDFKRGLDITEEIVKLDPKYPRTYENIIYYQVKFSEHQAMLAKQKTGKEATENPIRAINVTGEIWKEEDIHEAFKKLCRGEHVRSLEEESKLSCYYTTNNNSYLLLQPAKVEVLNLNPRIVLFHGVISDKEIHTLKELATPQLQRAVVQDTITGKIEPSTDRISKSTSLPYESHEIMTRLNKRIEDISGLTTFTSEQIHVINYGIGGHYEPHFDFAQAAEKIAMFRQLGNRIATWIFYMSDVPAGGATVFPIIGVDIKPVKGAAGFWYNLFKNGEGDKRTLHAACPVLAGSKWVGNLWLHERGQEFRRLCSLNPNE